MFAREQNVNGLRVYEQGCQREEATMTILMIHGAGYTAHTWLWLADRLSSPTVQIVAYDLRGHGQSMGSRGEDYSLGAMVGDAQAVFRQCCSNRLLVIGHSLGAAIATHLCAAVESETFLVALLLIDIVESVALRSLEGMPSLLARRPQSFANEAELIAWAVREGMARNGDIARLSTLTQYHLCECGEQEGCRLVARLDLRETAPFWTGWFTGLTTAFLEGVKCPRILCLAQRDYLDAPLLLGQMRGAFQLEIITDTGHAIQEEQPDQLATIIHEFMARQSAIERINRDYYARQALQRGDHGQAEELQQSEDTLVMEEPDH